MRKISLIAFEFLEIFQNFDSKYSTFDYNFKRQHVPVDDFNGAGGVQNVEWDENEDPVEAFFVWLRFLGICFDLGPGQGQENRRTGPTQHVTPILHATVHFHFFLN